MSAQQSRRIPSKRERDEHGAARMAAIVVMVIGRRHLMDAMFSRRLIPIVMFLTIWTSEAIAADWPNRAHWFCNRGGVSISDEIYDALRPNDGKSYWDGDCHDETCFAARDLQCAYGAIFGRDDPNTMGVGNAAESDREFRTFNRTIRNLGRTHPERRPLYCGFLAKAASLDLSHDDWYTDSETIEFATRLTRPHFDCIGKVMAAFPHTEAATIRIAHIKEGCELQAHPLCSRIVQPPPVAVPHT